MSPEELTVLILATLLSERSVQVPGYKRFRYSRMTPSSVLLLREYGNETLVPLAQRRRAVTAVQEDATIYEGGPARLRDAGLTHITSPLWALLHLLRIGAYR